MDILFVVGRHAPLMAGAEQGEALTLGLEHLFAELALSVGGMPDLHIAVIILVAGVAGDTSPIVVEERASGLTLAPSCGAVPLAAGSGALPPTRLRDFLRRFRHSVDVSICRDLGDSLATVGESMRVALGTRCLQGPLADKDPVQPGVQPHCVVTEHAAPLSGEPTSRVLRACGSPGSASNGTGDGDGAPCYELRPEPALCNAVSEPSHIEVRLYPENVSSDSRLSIRCELE